MAGAAGEGGAAPLRDVPEQVEIAERETIHEGYVWNVVSERFAFAGSELRREFIDHTGAVAVLALDDEDRALLIRQYRHPVRLRDWELPAGLLDEPGEAALEAARRELAEEADLTARDWSLLLDYFTTPGGSNESIRIFLARGLEPTDAPFERVHEEADMETRWVPIEELLEAVLANELHNPSLVVAALAAAHAKSRGWSTLRDAEEPWPTRPQGPTAQGTASQGAPAEAASAE